MRNKERNKIEEQIKRYEKTRDEIKEKQKKLGFKMEKNFELQYLDDDC